MFELDFPKHSSQNTSMKFKIITALLVLSFSQTPSAKDLKKINLCIPKGRSEFMEILGVIARDRGFFEKQGIQVKLVSQARLAGIKGRSPQGEATRHFLDYGVADKVSGNGSDCTYGVSTIEFYLSGGGDRSKTKALYVSSFGDQYDTHIMVPKKSKLKSIEQLRGKTVRLGQLPTFLATARMLEAHGMSLDDVKVSRGNGNDKFGPVFEGKIAATTAYLPSMAFFLATDQMRVLEANIIQKYVGRRIPHSLLIVNAKYAEGHSKEVLKFQTAMKEAHSYIVRNPEEIFHAYIRSKGSLFKREWRSNNLTVNIEKAASFVGDVPFVDLASKSESNFGTYCDVESYASELVRRKILPKTSDLRGWMGVPESAGKCPSVPAADRIAKSN